MPLLCVARSDGSCCSWDNSFSGAGSSSNFAVYCCADAGGGGEPPIEQCEEVDLCSSDDPNVTCATVNGECWCATTSSSNLSGVQMCGYGSASEAGEYYSASSSNCTDIAIALGGDSCCDQCDCATNYFNGNSLSSSSIGACWNDTDRWNRTGLDNVVRCTNMEGGYGGEIPSGDEDGDGVCDNVDECPGVDDALCLQVEGESCNSMPYYESVGGDVYVPMDCQPGDYDCQAHAMCNFVTGEECVYQDYTCSDGGGSYYPPSTGG